jgi:hypothetical protein
MDHASRFGSVHAHHNEVIASQLVFMSKVFHHGFNTEGRVRVIQTPGKAGHLRLPDVAFSEALVAQI